MFDNLKDREHGLKVALLCSRLGEGITRALFCAWEFKVRVQSCSVLSHDRNIYHDPNNERRQGKR